MQLRGRLLVLFVALATLLATAATAGARTDGLSTRLAQALAVPHVDHSREGALAVDLETGRVIFARNADRALVPASNEKVPVTYAALVAFGPEYRIATSVYLTGAGNLVLKGRGDPTLASEDLHVLAGAVRAAGVRSVKRVLADETFFDTKRTAVGWKPHFFINESPPLSALTVDRGKVGWRTSRDPARAAVQLFRAALKAAGVASGPAGRGAVAEDVAPVAEVLSPPMKSLVEEVNTDSDNFTAELVLKQLGALTHVPGTTAAGAKVVREILAASVVPMDDMRIADGSGLSLLNRISARTLVAIFEAAWLNPDLREPFRRSLAVAGRTGTLEDRMRGGPASGNVFAKTGTTSVSSSLSGYAGGRYAFAVLHNGSPVSSWWARRAQDRFATALSR